MSYSQYGPSDYQTRPFGALLFPSAANASPDFISHKNDGLTCLNDRPAIFGPLVYKECLPVGTFAHSFHRRIPTSRVKTGCGPSCNTNEGCICTLSSTSFTRQYPASLPKLYPQYPLDSSVFVD